MGAFTTSTPYFGDVRSLTIATDFDAGRITYRITVNDTEVYTGTDAREAIRVHQEYAPRLHYGVVERGQHVTSR